MDTSKRRFIVIVPDGSADYPISELGQKTIFQTAHIPHIDYLANRGDIGLVRTIPDGLPAGSDVANLSVLGYNPEKYYTGRSPLEAASIGVSLKEADIAYRCNLVTLRNERMENFCADHISTAEADDLINYLNQELAKKSNKKIHFYTGTSYRHLLVWENGNDEAQCTPPHDITGQLITPYLPTGEGSEFLRKLQNLSRQALENHPINKARITQGKLPANSIWLWGQGKKPHLPSFQEKYHLKGSLISAVDLLKGIGIYLGLTIINVPGATGYIDTNYQGKAEYALNALKDNDFIFIHIEAPDEAAHSGDIRSKVKSVENIDKLIVGTLLSGLKNYSNYHIMLLPDHYTPITVMTHTREKVPFVIYKSEKEKKSTSLKEGYNEILAQNSKFEFQDGEKLMDYFLK
ncbi:MAG: cofactor-independent phosphoglycerate mutase [bacterium]